MTRELRQEVRFYESLLRRLITNLYLAVVGRRSLVSSRQASCRSFWTPPSSLLRPFLGGWG
jgi:hypothetical protein